MYLPTQPEDSILRRHFAAAVEMKRQMWLQAPPTDSVLRRHALRAAGTLAGTPASPTSAAHPPARQAAPPKQGLFARLFDRFIRWT